MQGWLILYEYHYRRVKKYSGVFCQMKDEAGSDVMTFSAVGEKQECLGREIFIVTFQIGQICK